MLACSLLVQGMNPADERRTQKLASTADERIFSLVALACGSSSNPHGRKVNRWIEVEMKSINKLSVDNLIKAI